MRGNEERERLGEKGGKKKKKEGGKEEAGEGRAGKKKGELGTHLFCSYPSPLTPHLA